MWLKCSKLAICLCNGGLRVAVLDDIVTIVGRLIYIVVLVAKEHHKVVLRAVWKLCQNGHIHRDHFDSDLVIRREMLLSRH
jgi:hypothetical protein